MKTENTFHVVRGDGGWAVVRQGELMGFFNDTEKNAKQKAERLADRLSRDA